VSFYVTPCCNAQGDQLGRRSGLGAVEWLRVVLDEAHTIRNSETQQAKVGLCSRLGILIVQLGDLMSLQLPQL
jgi:hypothetical protein